MSHRQRMPQMGSRKWPRWRYVSSNMTEAEEARWVAMAQSGELRRQLAMFEKEVLRPASPRSAPSPNKPESQVGAADLPRAESGSHPDAPGTKKPAKTGTKSHPHHWILSEPAGPLTHGVCRTCGAEAINRLSAKQARVYRERRKQTPSVAPPCEWPDCGRLADDWNEKLLASRGGSRVDIKNRLWYGRPHHSYFHAHPQEMHELGLMPHAGDVPKC